MAEFIFLAKQTLLIHHDTADVCDGQFGSRTVHSFFLSSRTVMFLSFMARERGQIPRGWTEKDRIRDNVLLKVVWVSACCLHGVFNWLVHCELQYRKRSNHHSKTLRRVLTACRLCVCLRECVSEGENHKKRLCVTMRGKKTYTVMWLFKETVHPKVKSLSSL